MKVYFDFDIIFTKGRISRKTGNADIESEQKMSNMSFKTGKVFNVEITDIK